MDAILELEELTKRYGSHLAVDYLGPLLSPRAKHVIAVMTGGLITVYSVVVVIWGVRLALIGRMQTSPALQWNMGLVYLVFPVAGALMVLESIVALRTPGREGEAP